jgi:hypothetical protein
MAEPRPEPRPHTGTDLQPDAGSAPREASRPAAASPPPPPPPPPERATVVWTSTTSGSAGSVDHSQREE